MTATTGTPVQNTTALLSAVAAKGRAYTDARNSIVAHLLSIGVSQKVIVTEGGIDKGDVSRVNKVVATLTPAQIKKIKGLKVADMSADDTATLTDAITLGTLFRRNKPVAGASKPATKSETGEDESKDFRATLYDFLMGEGDYSVKLALITDVLETVEAERAALAAVAA